MPTVRDNGSIVDETKKANQAYFWNGPQTPPQTYDELIAALNGSDKPEQEQLTPQSVRKMVADAATEAGLPQPSGQQAQQPTPEANATPTEEVTPTEVQPQEPSEDENKAMAQRQLDDLIARRDSAKENGLAETANTLQKQIDNLLVQVPDLARETMAPSKPEDLAAPQEQRTSDNDTDAEWQRQNADWRVRALRAEDINARAQAFDAYTSGMVADFKQKSANIQKSMAAGGSTVEITSSFAPIQPLYTNVTGNVYTSKLLADMDNAYAKEIMKGQSDAINERNRLEALLPQWREQLAEKQKELKTIERPSSSASYLDEAPMIEGEIDQLQRQIEGAEARLGYIDEELATGNDPSINGMVKRQQKIVDELQKKLNARYAELRAQMDELAAQGQEENPIATVLTRGYASRAEYAAMNNDELVRAYSLALRTAKKTLQALQDQAKREAGGEVGFWRSFGRTLTDVSLWDFGLSSLGDALVKLNIASGEFKTPEEQAAAETVLQQTYYNQLVEQQYGANRNLREKGGEMTAEMASYMLDFLISGGESALSRGAIRLGQRTALRAVGREVYRDILGKGAYRYLAEGGMSALGREMGYYIPKVLGVAASDLIRAGQVTFGPRIVSNIAQVMENKVGDVEEQGGTLRFENKESWGRAGYNAFMDDFIESLSEMSGRYLEPFFSGKSAAKVAKWFGAKNLSQQLTWADEGTLGDIMRQTRRLFHKVELSGFPEEVAEEYVGQALKSIFNLDTAYFYDDNGVRKNLFLSGDFHAEIWSGMAMSMGMLEGLRQGYSGVRYRMVKHGLDICDATAQELLKGRWADLKEQIDNTKNEDAGAFFQNLWKMSGLSEEQMTAVSDYMTTLLAMRGLNLAQERRTAIRKEIGEDIANAAGEQRSNQNYLMGYSITDGGQRNGIRNIMTAAMQQLNELLGVAEDGTVIGNGVIAEIDAALDDPAELERIIAAHTEWGEREQRAVRNYIDAKQTYDGMIQRSRDDIDVGIAHQKAEIDSYTNKTTGKVQGATMKQDDRRVYIISGVVVPYDDRTGINTQASDKSVMVMDQNTGKIEMVSANDILITDDEELDPEDMKRQVEENLRASMSEEAAKQINGTVSLAEGTTHVVIGENGEPETVTVVPNEDGVIDNGDGTVNVTSDGGQTIRPMNKQYIQQQSQEQGTIRAGQAIAWSSGEVPQEQAPAQSQVPQVTATPVTEGKYGLNKKIRLRDSNGNEVVGTINSRNDVQHNYQYEVEIDGRIVPMTEEELDAAYIGEVEGAATEGALAQIPVNEQGERVYEQAQSPAVAWDALVEESEGDTGMAQETANEMVSSKQAELKAAQEAQQQPTQGTTPTEKIAEKKAKAAAVAKAQVDLAFWEAVANEQQRRANAEAQKQAAPQQEQQKQQPQQQKGESRKSVTESQQKQEEAKQIRMQSARALQERINKLAADIRKWVDGLGLHVPVRIARTQKELVDIAAEIDANNRAKAEKEANEKGLTGKERRTYINKHSTNYAARIQQNLQRGTVSNAFVTNDGTVVMYAPALYNGVEGVLDPTIRHQRAMARAHEVFAHEAVAHRGLQDLLGKEGFKKLCDEIYKGMSKAARERFVAYQWNYNMSDSQKGGLIGKAYAKRSWQSLTAAQRNKVWANKDAAEKLRRGAADEYAAHLAEKVLGNETLTEKEQSIWQKILSAIKKALGVVDDAAIADALVQARDNLRRGAQAQREAEAAEEARLSAEEQENEDLLSQADRITREQQEQDAQPTAEEILAKVKGQKQVGVEFEPLTQDEVDDIRFSIGKKRRAQMEATLNKHRQDLSDEERNALFSYLDDLDNTKEENATFKWFVGRTVRLPDDREKIRQAIKVAELAKVDPMQYDSPEEITTTHAEFIPKDAPIDPDTLPDYLYNKKSYGNGIVVYDVLDGDPDGDDVDECRQWLRKIIDTHWGKDANPWCLLQGDGEGNLTKRSAEYWYDYGRYAKKIAFKDGKLLAFFAEGETNAPSWWDRKDHPHTGIPVTMKIPNDPLGRTATYEYKIPIEEIEDWEEDYIEEDIREAEARIKEIKGHIDEADKRIDEIEDELGDIDERLDEIDDLLEDLRDEDDEANQEGIEALEEECDKLQSDREALVDEQNDRQSDKDQLEDELTQEETNLEDLEDKQWKDYYSEGLSAPRDIHTGNKKNGVYTEWYEGKPDQMSERTHYKNGMKNGLRETWYYDGKPAIRANYKDDERDGLSEEWNSNGQLTLRANYKDGELNGLHELWHPNGQLRMRETCKDGEIDGLHERWDEDGRLYCRENYKDGIKDGVQEYWYDNGQRKRCEEFTNGERNGLTELWYQNGQLEVRDNWKDGKKDGLCESWYENGQIKERCNYKDGKANGIYERWYDNGHKWDSGIYEDDKRVADLPLEDSTEQRNSVNENGNEDLFARAERIAREYEQQRSSAAKMSAAEQTRLLLGVAGQQEAGVERTELSPEDENDIRFSVGKNRKEAWNKILDKRRKDVTPEQRTALFDYLDGLNNTKEEEATFTWFVKGGVTLPVDRPQIQRALKVAEMAKVDPMQYNSPVELMDAFKDLAPKEEPIDPDSLPKYLYNKRVLADGVVVYDVADGRASNKKVKACREWLRKIINTHWGEDANPWCLLAGDGKGNLTQGSSGAWNLYNAEPKRIAFKDGKLLAFYATSGAPKWWDRKDDSYLDGIPVTRKMQGDELGRSATYVLNEATGEWSKPRYIHKGDKRNGEYTEWWDAEHIRSREHHKNGKMEGIAEAWYIDGTLKERVEWKDGMYDGIEETWWPDGTLQERIHWKEHLRDGLSEHWNEHGILKSRAIYKEGKQDGLTESYHDNGRISERANYKDGKKEGISTTYYTNGKIKTREDYKEGELNGLHEFWYENGVFGSRHNYKDGKLNGLAEWWYENGQKQEKAHFKDEKRDGKDEFWYEDGTPKYVENRKNGKLHGVQEYWDKNGTLTNRESYKNGVKDGTWEEWWPNGTLHSRQHFVDGQLDGTSEGWAEEGWYIGRMEWKNGERNGLDELWYPNGQLRERTNYKNGLKDGLDERWHENGQLHIRNNWKNGRMDGLSERWDEKGQLRARENYKNDKLDGLTERWYNDGQLAMRVNYKKGLADGTYESWYRNGQLMAYCEFKDGEYDGIREEWYPNGQIAERAYCKNGLRDGLVEGWAEDGTPIWSKRYENGIEITDEGESAPIRMSVEDAEKVLDTVKGQKQVGTQWHISLSDQQEIDGLRFSAEQSIGKKERARITGIVKRNRPNMSDEQCEALMVCLNDLYKKAAAPELLGQKAGKAVNAALKWYLMGDITLPKDGDKVIEAIVRGERANQANQARRARGEALLETDASQYPTLKAMMDALVKYKSKEPPIDPDTVPTLTNKRVLSHGVVIYDVVDGNASDPAVEESRKNLRRIIDTHWGEDRNPWCLLAGDGKGNLRSDSYGYWNRYNKYPKRVAFQNGRLLAFFASNDSPKWWNDEDHSSSGIPITSKMRGDKLGRSAIRTMNEKTGRLGKPMLIFKGNKSNGTYEQWYVDDPDKIQLRANHKDGKLNGLQERWYDNGQIAERAYCKDGLRDGLVEGWYEDGTLRERKNFKNDKKDGLSEYWYENGQINARINYKDGHLNGMDEHWHENGQLEARGEFVNGNREGLHENWDANGMLTRRGNYQDDRVEGLYERWNDGQLVERENWHDGEQDGLQESWWNNGQMRFRGTYKNGVKNGVFEEWTEDGKLKEHITYMDGTYDGLYEIYYLNGKLRTRENYVKGKLAGTVEGWYDNGQMKYRGQRRGGTEIGVSESWYDNGQMESRYHFDDHGAMDGIQEKWYRNGQKKEEIEYAHGEQNGIYKVWFENGQQKINATNKNGKWDGKYEEWWDNGQLGRLEYYKDGNYGDGLQQRWHKNGQLASRAVMKDGKWEGLMEGWHPNGQIYQRVPYKEGLREGPYEEWDEYGRLEKRINYKNNEKDGLSEEWYHGGQIKSRLHFKDGEADGSMEYWYDNGQMMSRSHYKTGKGRVGTYEEWWEHNGKPRLLENYNDEGVRDGEQKEWNDNGNLKERQYYKDGVKDGVQEKYYYDGKLRIRDNYKNGVLEGEDEQYYSNGQLMSRDHYIDGHLDGISEEWDMDGNLTRRVQWTMNGGLANDLPLEDDTEQRNSVLEREGNGELSDDELSAENDAMSKAVGHNVRTAKQRKAMATRLRREMRETVEKMAERLHLTDVDILDNGSGLTGALARSKGFYNQRTGKITIIIGNNSSLPDVVKTVLHEAVAHHGLRQLFGTYFDEFLDNVYKEATKEIRHDIAELAARNDWNFRRATEEYLAELAERMDEDFIVDENGHFPSWWTKVKKYFYGMLNRALGGYFRNIDDIALTDNELRYILWSSYDNLRNPNRSSNVYSQAADIAMRDKLDIGDYNSNAEASIDQQVANANDILMREGETRNSVDEAPANEDLFSRAERIAREYEAERAEDIRMSVDYERMEVADWYERLMSSGRYQSVEAFMDSMLSLKKVMEKIFPLKKGQHVEDIPWFENAYIGENTLSSRNEAELNAVRQLLVDPLTQAVHRLTGGRQSQRETMTRYMMAKHGLERNVYMAQRDARAEFDEYQKEHPRGTKTLQDFINEKRMKDYAGLTALTNTDNVYDAEQMAQQMVEDYEGSHSSAAIKDLWDKVRALNAMTLSKQYESGFLTRANYDKISGMYQYYIPLRGFDEETSEDVYTYIGHQSGVMNTPIKKAKGRKSRADDPIAVMQAMAESAVLQGNRNVFVKQRFMNFAMNHPSDLVSISELWLKYDDEEKEWKPVLPPQNPDELEQWEKDMQAKAAAEPDRYAKASDTMSIPYRVLSKKNLEQHQVIVRRGGKDYILTVNGNPRLAQAINGETNPDNPNKEGWSMALLDSFGAINRALSGIYTTLNPDFIVSNFCRDMIYSNSMVWVKEKPKYARQFHKNIMRANPMMIKILFAKLRNGRLNMDNELERLFYEFITNGGETGYARRTDTEEIKRKFEKKMRSLNEKIPATEIRNLAATVIGEIGRSVELCARFAAFITSREFGRDIDRSVYDGKEISVNFNKKGSGDKFFGARGQTRLGNVSAFTSGMGRALYLFWNASLQGTFGNFLKNIARHPAKGAVLVASYLALGVARAWLGAIGGSPDGDDDEMPDSYFNFSQYTRRSNLMIKGTGKAWIKIPLSIEYRAIYGLGEMFGSALFRGEEITMNDYMEQVCQLMPLDMTEGRNEHTKDWTGDLANWIRPLIPATLKPMFEVGFNYNYMGRPIYKEKSDYNQWVPAWMRVYPTTNQTIVNFCKWLNELGDGDSVDKGHGIDINPAGVEYLLRSYVPFYTFVNEIMNTIDVARGEKDYNPMYIPLLNRVMAYSNDRTGNGALTGDFFEMSNDIDRTKDKFNGYRKNIKLGHEELRSKLYDLVWEPEFARYQAVNPYDSKVSDLGTKIRQGEELIANSEKQELTDEQKAALEKLKEDVKNAKAQRQWLMEQALWIYGQIRDRNDYYKMNALKQIQYEENKKNGIKDPIDMTTINVYDKENPILDSERVKEMVDSMREEDEENFKKILNQE